MMKKQVFMFMKNKLFFLVPMLFVLLLTGCSESKYSKLVKTEISKNKINDSLFLGLKLGQSQKKFFDICWKLNQDKIVTNSEDMFVHYKLPSHEEKSTTGDMDMYFYGIFDKKKVMTGMKMRFSYKAWSLWNKAVQSDKLIYAVQDTLRTWYPGNDFLKIKMKKSEKELLIKVDGTRRITIKPIDDDEIIKVQIDDLRYVLNE